MKRITVVGAISLIGVAACQNQAALPAASGPAMPSVIMTMDAATVDDADWGEFLLYSTEDTIGTRASLTGVAIIKPGEEIHPPHRHAEEEYLMVLEGEGTWSLLGEERTAKAGDMLYAAPWDIHGITNTGDVPLKFVVWKWNSAGLPTPLDPEAE